MSIDAGLNTGRIREVLKFSSGVMAGPSYHGTRAKKKGKK